MAQVTQLAELRGWQWAHFRPAMTAKGWRTPVSGPLGKGWPDLVLVRRDRIIFAELKADRGALTADQERVLRLLDDVDPSDEMVKVHIWRPRYWDHIEEALR